MPESVQVTRMAGRVRTRWTCHRAGPIRLNTRMQQPTAAGWQAPPAPARSAWRRSRTTPIVVFAVVVVLIGVYGYWHFTLGGRYSKISHPCRLLSNATVATLIRHPSVAWEMPGESAVCQWRETSTVTTGVMQVDLSLWSSQSELITSGRSRARSLFDMDRGATTRPVPGLGDEAVLRSGVSLLVRSDNLVWALTVIGAGPDAGDVLLRPAREIQTNLKRL